MTIEPLTPTDETEWLALWNAYLVFYEATLTREQTALTFARIVDPDGNLNGAIARDADGRAVGFVHWLTHPATWAPTDYTYLEDLFVDPSYRGGGVGRALIAHVRDWATGHGSATLYWLTQDTNSTARALYDRVATSTGFVHYEIALDGA